MKNYTKDSPEITKESIEWLANLPLRGRKKRIPEILRMRLRGITLKEIAKHFGVSPERIRQQEAAGVERIRYATHDVW